MTSEASRQRTKFGAAAIAVISVCAAVYVLANSARNLESVPSTAALLLLFERTAFISSFGPKDRARKSLAKFEGSMEVRFRGFGGGRLQKFSRRHLDKISSLTALRFIYVDREPKPPGLVVEFGSQTQMQRAALSRGLGLQDAEILRDYGQCLYLTPVRGSGRTIGYVFIPNDISGQEARACVVEELTQYMGLTGDTNVIANSIFRTDDDRDSLSISDMIVLRTLYDPSMRARMPKAEAMRLAGEIIPELRKTYLEDGVEALYQR